MEVEAESSEHGDEFGGECELPVELGTVLGVQRDGAHGAQANADAVADGRSEYDRRSLKGPTEAVAQVL